MLCGEKEEKSHGYAVTSSASCRPLLFPNPLYRPARSTSIPTQSHTHASWFLGRRGVECGECGLCVCVGNGTGKEEASRTRGLEEQILDSLSSVRVNTSRSTCFTLLTRFSLLYLTVPSYSSFVHCAPIPHNFLLTSQFFASIYPGIRVEEKRSSSSKKQKTVKQELDKRGDDVVRLCLSSCVAVKKASSNAIPLSLSPTREQQVTGNLVIHAIANRRESDSSTFLLVAFPLTALTLTHTLSSPTPCQGDEGKKRVSTHLMHGVSCTRRLFPDQIAEGSRE